MNMPLRSTIAKRYATSALLIAMGCLAAHHPVNADEVGAGSAGSPKIELKKPERSQPATSTLSVTASASGGAAANGQGQGVKHQTQSSVSLRTSNGKPSSGSPSTGTGGASNSTSGFASASASAGGSASASGNGNGGVQAFGSSIAGGSIQTGTAPSASTPSTGSSRGSSANGEAISRSTVIEGDQEITIVSAVTPRQEITIRQSSDGGIELQLKPRSRSGKDGDEGSTKKAKTFKAASLDEFKTKHAKLYPMIEKYLLSQSNSPVAVNSTGNEAQSMAIKQIEEMIQQNAGNPLLQDALRQSLDSIKAAK